MSNEKIEIIVSSKFLPERSDPTKSLFSMTLKLRIMEKIPSVNRSILEYNRC